MSDNNDRVPFAVKDLLTYYWKGYSVQDKDVSAGFGVYNGRSSFSLRRNGQKGAPMASVNITPEQLWTFVYAADLIAKQGPKGKLKLTIQKWDNENRKFNDTGVFVVGIDEKMVPYFGLSTPEVGVHTFPIRLKRPNILGDENVSKEMGVAITIKAVCQDIAEHLTQLEVFTAGTKSFGNNSQQNNQRKFTPTPRPSENSSIGDDTIPF